jgi:hypothetical protein
MEPSPIFPRNSGQTHNTTRKMGENTPPAMATVGRTKLNSYIQITKRTHHENIANGSRGTKVNSAIYPAMVHGRPPRNTNQYPSTSLLPASPEYSTTDPHGMHTVTISPTGLASPDSPQGNIQPLKSKILEGFPDGHVIWEIVRAPSRGALTLQCSGNGTVEGKQGNYSWAFATTRTISSSAYTCHSDQISSIRAVLFSILAGVLIVQQLEERVGRKLASIYIDCNNTQALWLALQKGPGGVRLAAQDNSDLIMEIKQLLRTIKMPLKAQQRHWEKKGGLKEKQFYTPPQQIATIPELLCYTMGR